MSTGPADAKVDHPAINKIHGSSPKIMERRRRVRFEVQWPVCIWASDSPPVETVTTDLTSDGFHCLSPVPLEPSSLLACTLMIPEIPNQAGNGKRRVLECQVRVIRLEPPNKDGDFGLGCRIENFSIATDGRPGRSL
jgi:hypothetical protein